MNEARGGAPLAPPTPWLVAWFKRYARRYVARSFHAVRVGGIEHLPRGGEPVVVYCNHPSWWDPMIATLLAERAFAERDHWALIDASQLERYRFFARLGFVGVEPGTRRGARRLLDVADDLAGRRDATLWLTPQGRFADPRERPLALAGGLERLARRVPGARFVPLALEYPFGEERLPEARALFGECVRFEGLGERRGVEGTPGEVLATRLTATADALADTIVARSLDGFETILEGRAGVGGVYDLWRRARAKLRGERFDTAHAAREGADGVALPEVSASGSVERT